MKIPAVAKCRSLPVLLLVVSLLPLAGPRAAQVQIGNQTFTVPDGFEIERVAGTDLAARPVSAGFDDQGRLYVTDSSGSNLPPEEQLKNPTHRVVRLEDTDGDGRFDRSVVFAERVMFPQGCLWHAGSVYVSGPPSIWKFTDADGDGVAEQREEWFKGGTLTGCANDIHGPHLGPDGYIYWTKGAAKEQTHVLGNGRKLNDRASHIFRSKPDGSGLEVVMTGGMDNPVEVAFTAEGEVVFTSTFIDFSQPGWRDGIGHASYGAVFGKETEVLEDGRVKRTGPELTHPFVQFGPGAPSGLCRYQSSVLGADYRDNLFASTFNLHKITRHKLRLSGASYASEDSDFVVSDSLDFHPTDVLEDADGSLLVVDTGGWYKLCCPSSQLAKADVLGGIYRVRRKGAPLLAKTARADAYRRLTQPPGLAKSELVDARRRIWAADEKSAEPFRALLREHSMDAGGRPESAWLVRLAAEGLGKLRAKESVSALIGILADNGTKDAALAQSIIAALIDIEDAGAVRQYATSDNIFVRRAALIALDQMDGGDLAASGVIPLLASSDPGLRKVAAWIAGHHSNWGSALAESFQTRLTAGSLAESERAELERQLGRFARNGAVQQLLASVAGDSGADSARVTALRGMSAAALKEPPASWATAVIAALGSSNSEVQRQAVLTARAFPTAKNAPTEFRTALESVGNNSKVSSEVRLEALAAIPGGVGEVDENLFALLKSSLSPNQAVATRASAATTLARAKLSEEQLMSLSEVLRTVGPLDLPKVLPAFGRSPSETVGQRLVASLESCQSASSLRPEVLRPCLTNFPESVQAKGEALLGRLNVDAAKQSAHLDALLGEVRGKGDIRRGQAIFNSAKTACSVCHAIGYLGGKVGPDLTRISEVRSERDLLESIVYPSASFVRSYEPVLVTTRSGEEYSGVLRKDGADEVVLATGPNTEARVARADIAELRPGTVSVMPQGLDEQLSRQELADLLAFLKGTKWGPR
jgi:putative membrane-bound dehydrogenase-like protein